MGKVNFSTRVRQVLYDSFAASCLGLTIVSLAVPPSVAWAKKASLKAPEQANQKLWDEPLSQDQKIVHLLNRITFGPRPGDIERVREEGLKAFLTEQLHPERLDDSAVETRLTALPSLSMNSEELLEKFKQPKPEVKPATPPAATPTNGVSTPASAQPASAKVDLPKPAPPPRPSVMTLPGPQRVVSELAREEVWRAVYSNRQLQEVMVQFWMNHFNIFAPKGADRWLMTSFERDAIRPHALGKFEDLLVATAENPAMLYYLDNWMSATPFPAAAGSENRGRGKPAPRTRFGRRNRRGFGGGSLDPAGGATGLSKTRPKPPVAQAKGRPGRGLNENYGREIMELHTLGVDGGYSQKDVVEVARSFTGWTIDKPDQHGNFVFNPKMHDYDKKVVLGHKIKAGRGMEDGLTVIHLLARHPSTAHFISLKLCRRFVADEPPESVVHRASKTYLKSHGDIRKVLETIFTSPEFYSQAAFRAKVKSPLELVASSLRALGGETDADLPILQAIQRMGQTMFQYEAPTGFPDRENTWINSGTLLARMNFAMTLAANRVPGTEINLKEVGKGEDRPEAIVDDLVQRTVGGVLDPGTRKAILARLAQSNTTAKGSVPSSAYATAVAGLLLASPEFQRR